MHIKIKTRTLFCLFSFTPTKELQNEYQEITTQTLLIANYILYVYIATGNVQLADTNELFTTKRLLKY